MNTLKLFFGRTRNGWAGVPVSHYDFERFCKRTVDPLISGYTVTDAIGHFEGKQERAFVIEAALLGSDSEAAEIAVLLALAYARDFEQESVFYTVTPCIGNLVFNNAKPDTVEPLVEPEIWGPSSVWPQDEYVLQQLTGPHGRVK